MASSSDSYSVRTALLRFLVSDGVGVDKACSGEGENRFASVRADRPPGSDWMFSFWFSIISKSMRSSETDILS